MNQTLVLIILLLAIVGFISSLMLLIQARDLFDQLDQWLDQHDTPTEDKDGDHDMAS